MKALIESPYLKQLTVTFSSDANKSVKNNSCQHAFPILNPPISYPKLSTKISIHF